MSSQLISAKIASIGRQLVPYTQLASVYKDLLDHMDDEDYFWPTDEIDNQNRNNFAGTYGATRQLIRRINGINL